VSAPIAELLGAYEDDEVRKGKTVQRSGAVGSVELDFGG
jgi:hypothetical protein